MRKLVFLIIVMAAGALLIGLPNLVYSIRYRQPVPVDCGQAVPVDLPAYVKLQHIRVTAMEAIQTSSRRGTKIYLPVHAAGKTKTERLTMVLASDDPELLVAATRLGGQATLAKSLQVMQVFSRKTEATGMTGGFVDSDLRQQLTAQVPELAEDFIVVTEGESPSIGLAALALGNAAALLSLLHWIWKRNRAGREVAPPVINSGA